MIILDEISKGLNTLEVLRKEIEHFAFLNQYGFSEGDIRFHFPNQINRVLIFNNLNLSYFERVIRHKEKLDEVLPTPTNADHFYVMENYIKMARLNLATNLCMVLENYIRKIMESVEKKDNHKEKIFELRKRLFEMMNIEEGDMIRKAQTILFEIRNGIHNNSVFSKKGERFEKSIFYGYKLHIFKYGTPINSADLETLSHIVKDVFEFYKLTLDMQQLKNLQYIPGSSQYPL